ncbi:hypothetical protein [Motilimonas sp. KMU-193]
MARIIQTSSGLARLLQVCFSGVEHLCCLCLALNAQSAGLISD